MITAQQAAERANKNKTDKVNLFHEKALRQITNLIDRAVVDGLMSVRIEFLSDFLQQYSISDLQERKDVLNRLHETINSYGYNIKQEHAVYIISWGHHA